MPPVPTPKSVTPRPRACGSVAPSHARHTPAASARYGLREAPAPFAEPSAAGGAKGVARRRGSTVESSSRAAGSADPAGHAMQCLHKSRLSVQGQGNATRREARLLTQAVATNHRLERRSVRARCPGLNNTRADPMHGGADQGDSGDLPVVQTPRDNEQGPDHALLNASVAECKCC